MTSHFSATSEAGGVTVKKFLKCRFRLSLNALRKIKKFGSVLVNRNPSTLAAMLSPGDIVEAFMPETGLDQVSPENLDLPVLHEDDFILVVDKPAGMVSHPTPGYPGGTVVNGVRGIWENRGEKRPARLIGRLDSGTSGLMVVAKSSHVHGLLSLTPMKKEYLCLVHGRFDEAEGYFDMPLARTRGDATTRVREDGKPSMTRFRVLAETEAPLPAEPLTADLPSCPETNRGARVSRSTIPPHPSDRDPDFNMPPPAGYSLLSITIETGRTHQIRAHMAHSGHPVAGDDLYGGDRSIISRPALHCHRLSYVDPFTGIPVSFSAPIPADLAKAAEMAGMDLRGFE